jgi:hypothetical protein
VDLTPCAAASRSTAAAVYRTLLLHEIQNFLLTLVHVASGGAGLLLAKASMFVLFHEQHFYSSISIDSKEFNYKNFTFEHSFP